MTPIRVSTHMRLFGLGDLKFFPSSAAVEPTALFRFRFEL
jgi:hypothetical protein